MSKKYLSSWFEFWLNTFLLSVGMTFGYLQNGINKYLVYASLIFFIYLLYLAYKRAQTRLEITPDNFLKNIGQRDFGQDLINIFSIQHIARARAFPWKSWGSLMIMYLVNENGELRQTYLREASYSADTLKKIIVDLKKINPRIELDKQYQQLLASPPEDGWGVTGGFKAVAAERTVNDIEEEMKKRYGK